jgi:hypothetical protein
MTANKTCTATFDLIPQDPVPDIKATGSNGPITISLSVNSKLTVWLDPKGSSDNVDYWVLCDTDFGWFYYKVGCPDFSQLIYALCRLSTILRL